MPDEVISSEKSAEHKGVMKVIHVIDVWLIRIEKSFMVVASVLLFLNMTWNVLARYVFDVPTPYNEELSLMLYMWVTFWGVSYLLSQDAHPTLTIFSGKVKNCANAVFRKCYFTLIYGVILFFVGLTGKSGVDSMPLYFAQKTVSLRIPFGFIYGVVVVAMLVMSVRCVCKIVEIWVGEK